MTTSPERVGPAVAAALFAGVAVLAGGALGAGSAGAEEFRHRGWAGDLLPDDKDNGCVMAVEARGGGGFVIYGNAQRAFRIGVGGRELGLEPGKPALAAVAFDDGPPMVLKGAAVTRTLALFEPLDFEVAGGLARLVESSRTVRLTYGKRYLKAGLSGSSRAVELLARCAAGPVEDARTAAGGGDPGASGRGGPSGAGRMAEIGFLRQGMAAAEANDKLLGAGWQAEEEAPPPAEGVPDARLARLKARGLPVRACDAFGCAIDYADAFGNALRVTASADPEPKLKSWRLNPPEPRDAPDGSPPPEEGEPGR